MLKARVNHRRFYLFIMLFVAAFYGLIVHPAAPAELGWSIERDFVFGVSYSYPGYVERLKNGNLLVCQVGFRSPGVIEVTPEGNEIWRCGNVQPASAKRLDNGNTLIADAGLMGSTYPGVIEVNPQGRTVWEYRLSSAAYAPRYAERLADGSTLITLPFQIIEVNRRKEVVWAYGAGRPVPVGSPEYLAFPTMASRLDNGNTMIVDRGFINGRVFEVNRQKQSLRDLGGVLRSPESALRLDNGSTVIADSGARKIIYVSSNGSLVRSFSYRQVLSGLSILNCWHVKPLSSDSMLVSFTAGDSRSWIWLININSWQD